MAINSHARQRLSTYSFGGTRKQRREKLRKDLIFSVIVRVNSLQSGRKGLRNHKPASQATVLYFMMQTQDVQCQTEQQPFGGDLYLSAKQEASEIKILLDIGKGAFGLNGAIDSQQLAFWR